MMYRPTPIIVEVAELASRSEGPLFVALSLILRGDRLAYPVKRALLSAAASMLDAVDVKKEKASV
jgi:hypothetical protein